MLSGQNPARTERTMSMSGRGFIDPPWRQPGVQSSADDPGPGQVEAVSVAGSTSVPDKAFG